MRIDRGPLLSSGPAQEGALLLAEPDDGDEAFRAGQNRDQAEKQDFLKRIDHLAKLPAIRRVLEIREKNSRLGRLFQPLRTGLFDRLDLLAKHGDPRHAAPDVVKRILQNRHVLRRA
jgi:hypothetical protein